MKHKSRRDDSRERARDSVPRSREVSAYGPLRIYSRVLIDRIVAQTSKPSTPAANTGPTEDEKRAERLAKLEAWKQKQAAEKERKQREAAAAGGARSILDEIDRKSGLSPAVGSPQSPATPVDAAPAAYAGKFDPKAIAKSAAPAPAVKSVLGDDIAVPPPAKTSATFPSTKTQVQANKPSATTSKASCTS